jgi:hypothetical protein
MFFRWFWSGVSIEWMKSRQAALAFGFASVMVCVTTGLLLSRVDTAGFGRFDRYLCDVAAVIGAFSVPFLWGGMTKFLEMTEQTEGEKSPIMRLFLLLGIWYAAVIYYLFFYLPMRNSLPIADPGIWVDFPAPPPPPLEPSRPIKRNRLSQLLGYVVFVGWGIFGLFVICSFISPSVSKFVQPVAVYLVLYPLFMLLLTASFTLIRFINGRP